MTRASLLTTALVCLPVMAMGQTWQNIAADTGRLIYAGTVAPEYSLTFTCNAPSPQRRPLIETEDHETILNSPFGMFITLSAELVRPVGGEVLPAVTVTLDGTGYRLPPVRWDELYSEWMVELAMADPLFGALAAASDLVLDSGTGAAWRYPVDGLAEGVVTAMSACATGWVQAGFALPPALGGAAQARSACHGGADDARDRCLFAPRMWGAPTRSTTGPSPAMIWTAMVCPTASSTGAALPAAEPLRGPIAARPIARSRCSCRAVRVTRSRFWVWAIP